MGQVRSILDFYRLNVMTTFKYWIAEFGDFFFFLTETFFPLFLKKRWNIAKSSNLRCPYLCLHQAEGRIRSQPCDTWTRFNVNSPPHQWGNFKKWVWWKILKVQQHIWSSEVKEKSSRLRRTETHLELRRWNPPVGFLSPRYLFSASN